MKLCTDLVAHGFQKCMFDDKKKKAVDYLGLIVKDFLLTWNWYTSSGEHMKLNPEATQWFVPPQKRMLLSWTWWWDVSSNYHSYLWNSQTICQYLIQLEWNKMVRRCSSHVIWQGCGGEKKLARTISQHKHTHTSWRGFKGHFLLQLEMCHAFSKQAKEEMKQHFDESCLAKTRWEKQFKEKTFGPQVTKSKRKERRICKYALNVIWCAIQWICRQIWDLVSKCLYTTYKTYMCHVTI